MGFILLIVIPIALVVCIVCALRWTGTSIIPKELLMPSKQQFRFPKLSRTEHGWRAEDVDSDDEDEDDSDDEFDAVVPSETFSKNLYD